MELFDAMQDAWSNAPLREDLDDTPDPARLCRPLEGDDKNLREFLLVPYFGACIHFPRRPATRWCWSKCRARACPWT
ncbi:DUF3299 domain-containing protein [Alcanivorax sp. IO_7]|nr:DUF3299 domain-containing protein [Alcanivorax sp. IO_7]